LQTGDLLTINDLVVEYKTRRGTARGIDGVSLSLPCHTTLGIAGESGCGKSTLGRAIIRLVPYPGRITNGSIEFELDRDVNVPDKDPVRAGRYNLLDLNKDQMRALRGEQIAYIFQDPMTSLNPMLNIRKHYREVLKAHNPRIEDEVVTKRTEEVLDALGISPERMNDYPHQFSGGMRQRVMIGLGLVLRPRLLIADEPTTSLDVIVEAQILQEMARLKRDFDLTMILITHNLGVLAETADMIAIVYAGRVVELGNTITIFEDPLHPYTKALLDSVPDVRKPDRKLAWIPGAPPELTHPIPGCMFNPRCSHAMDICREIQPPLQPDKNGSQVACYLYQEAH